MSVVITISDDGHIEATHNSGRVLWSMELDEFAEPGFDEVVADWIGEVTREHAAALNDEY